MGFFDIKSKCVICGKQSRFNMHKLSGEEDLCSDCFVLTGMGLLEKTEQYTVEDIKNKIIEKKRNEIEKEEKKEEERQIKEKLAEERREKVEKFTTTFCVKGKIHFDDNDKKWLIPDGWMGGIKNPFIYDYSDILDYEVIKEEHMEYYEDEEDKSPEKVCDRLIVYMSVNSAKVPTRKITFIDNGILGDIKVDSYSYRSKVDEMNKLVFQIKRVLKYNKQAHYQAVQEARAAQVEEQEEAEVVQVVNNVSAADEIMKFKGLLDAGIISLEEFNAKKEQLLDL